MVYKHLLVVEQGVAECYHNSYFYHWEGHIGASRCSYHLHSTIWNMFGHSVACNRWGCWFIPWHVSHSYWLLIINVTTHESIRARDRSGLSIGPGWRLMRRIWCGEGIFTSLWWHRECLLGWSFTTAPLAMNFRPTEHNEHYQCNLICKLCSILLQYDVDYWYIHYRLYCKAQNISGRKIW